LKLHIFQLYSGIGKEVIFMPNQQQLIKAALIVAGFGIVILSLTYVVPLLGILGAGAIIVAGIYAIYLFLTGKLKI